MKIPDYEGELKKGSHTGSSGRPHNEKVWKRAVVWRERSRKHLLTHALNTNISCRETGLGKQPLCCLCLWPPSEHTLWFFFIFLKAAHIERELSSERKIAQHYLPFIRA